jgi:hypothetical protein
VSRQLVANATHVIRRATVSPWRESIQEHLTGWDGRRRIGISRRLIRAQK